MKANVVNIQGEVVGEVELNEAIFGIEPNEPVVHQVVVAYLANQRQGTQSAKTRGEVSGGGKKPWRQKGTGRARAGSNRSPLWRHGGVIFAPKPRDYSKSVNKKVKRLAVKSVLSAKYADNELIILDSIRFDEPKTKKMIEVFGNLGANKPLLVIKGNDRNVYKSVSNIPKSKCMPVSNVNVYEMLKYDQLVLTKESLETLQEVYS
ncbi:MAG: 50S ribosomal protein L4 [Eubacteriaceae bacterium]|nr:50S ribosomal protein L4 [Eubacteriaceae bacterium]